METRGTRAARLPGRAHGDREESRHEEERVRAAALREAAHGGAQRGGESGSRPEHDTQTLPHPSDVVFDRDPQADFSGRRAGRRRRPIQPGPEEPPDLVVGEPPDERPDEFVGQGLGENDHVGRFGGRLGLAEAGGDEPGGKTHRQREAAAQTVRPTYPRMLGVIAQGAHPLVPDPETAQNSHLDPSA
jgi:hypothetical protein